MSKKVDEPKWVIGDVIVAPYGGRSVMFKITGAIKDPEDPYWEYSGVYVFRKGRQYEAWIHEDEVEWGWKK